MTKKFSFENLEIWQLAIKFAKNIYKLTKDFPTSERFGMISQLTRAAVSISTNIAEGTSRKSNKDQAHFIEITYGSLLETVSILIFAAELEYIKENQLDEIRIMAFELTNKLTAYRNYLLKDNA